jgi:hypothetical protein
VSSWSAVPARTRARIRAAIAATLPAPCPRCGLPVHPDAFDVDHLDPCLTNPEAIMDVTRMAAAHPGCNRAAGARPITTTGWSAPWL